MEQVLGLIKIAVVFALIFGLPLGGVVAFVYMRAKKRREERAAPWGALAEKWNGSFDGDRVVCEREGHKLVLDVQMVSVMQAAGSPYWSDGGTFTRAQLTAPRPVAKVAQPTRVSFGQVAELVPQAKQLPVEAVIVLEPKGAAVVLDGSVTDHAQLELCFSVLFGLFEVSASEPFSVAPPA